MARLFSPIVAAVVSIAVASPSLAFEGAQASRNPDAPAKGTAPAKQAASAKNASFPEEWFWRSGASAEKHRAMVGKPPPPLKLKNWHGEPADLAQLRDSDVFSPLKGKVVVVDFWATWCGPCRKALPENVEMVRDLGSKGVVVIGVHDAKRGSETMIEVADGARVNYPLAVDDGGASAKAWAVGFWPTYGVVDQSGVVRAVGLQPQHVRTVVEQLLAETKADGHAGAPAGEKPANAKEGSSAAKDATADKRNSTKPAAPASASTGRSAMVRSEFLEGNPQRRAALSKFNSAPVAPDLGASQWRNIPSSLGSVSKLSDLEGKIVVIDFWATWCGPCIQSIPKLNELSEKYADKGVVILGVCHSNGGDKMSETATSKGIKYPICLDASGKANSAYVVDGYPDYYIIGRDGRVIGADVANGRIEDAIKSVLASERGS